MLWFEYPGVAERYESKIIRSATCWTWAGGRAGPGYGAFRISKPVRRQAYAHRLALERKIGRELGRKEYALHSCDNPICVNPDHLSVGDQVKNMRDSSERGRIARGESASWARLTDQNVREIRALLAAGALQQEIADRYGVSRPAISYIKSGRNYRHVT